MARLPALVERFADIGHHDRGAVDHVAREIREQNWIQTTKRGRGAAEMTPRDAAALTVALYAAETLPDRLAALPVFLEMVRGEQWLMGAIDSPSSLEPLVQASSFGQALELLFEQGSLFELPTDWRLHDASWTGLGHIDVLRARAPRGPSVVVRLQQIDPRAMISFVWPNRAASVSPVGALVLSYGPKLDAAARKAADESLQATGRRVTVELDATIFKAVHQTLFCEAAQARESPI